MTTDKKKESEAIEEAERIALLDQPPIDEDDESNLIVRIFPDVAPEHRLYIPGDPEFPGPPRAASK